MTKELSKKIESKSTEVEINTVPIEEYPGLVTYPDGLEIDEEATPEEIEEENRILEEIIIERVMGTEDSI